MNFTGKMYHGTSKVQGPDIFGKKYKWTRKWKGARLHETLGRLSTHWPLFLFGRLRQGLPLFAKAGKMVSALWAGAPLPANAVAKRGGNGAAFDGIGAGSGRHAGLAQLKNHKIRIKGA